ncbi:MAG: YigZ family protein [Ruminococcaceae bacterium]|nr:YigZ family protein [Oscillospiraceae bacterium]
MEKNYRTVKTAGRAEFIEKKSRFIATVRPVTAEAEALALINEMKKEFSDATHNVYAYILRNNNIARFSDDGEPSGTAGMPVMEVLRQEELTDVAVVVTRYFGGTLLGAGGLVRAYSKTAKLGIDAAGAATMTYCAEVQIVVSYDLYGKLQYLLEQENLQAGEADFGQEVTITVFVRAEQLESLEKKVIEATNGRVGMTVLGTDFKLID